MDLEIQTLVAPTFILVPDVGQRWRLSDDEAMSAAHSKKVRPSDFRPLAGNKLHGNDVHGCLHLHDSEAISLCRDDIRPVRGCRDNDAQLAVLQAHAHISNPDTDLRNAVLANRRPRVALNHLSTAQIRA